MAGKNGVMIAFADATGATELTWIPPSATLTANGKAHIGWVSGPVRAEVHHWLVGSARPARSGPACTGALVGRIPAGSVPAMLPLPDGRGAVMGPAR